MTRAHPSWRVAAIAAFATVLLCGCNSFEKIPEGEAQSFETRAAESQPTEYRIQPGDGLAIKYAYQPTRNLDVIVRLDGRISIPFAEEVHVAGRTIEEADALLTERVGKVLRDPDLTVVLTTMAKSQVFIGGEVTRPGAVPLAPGMTAYQALLAAGGVAPTGDEKSVIVIRAAGPGRRTVWRLDLEGQGLVTHDVVLGPYDIVFVPRTFVADVGAFVNSHINAIIPRAANFSAFYNLADPTNP